MEGLGLSVFRKKRRKTRWGIYGVADGSFSEAFFLGSSLPGGLGSGVLTQNIEAWEALLGLFLVIEANKEDLGEAYQMMMRTRMRMRMMMMMMVLMMIMRRPSSCSLPAMTTVISTFLPLVLASWRFPWLSLRSTVVSLELPGSCAWAQVHRG